jgi:hypothetical protein
LILLPPESVFTPGEQPTLQGNTWGSLNPDSLTKKFIAAKKVAGISLEESPPTSHEIRSLAGRRYEKERGKEYAML